MTLNPLIGIGLRAPHYKQVLEELPSIGWFEVHSENFFAQGGNAINLLQSISARYPISLHGVGLSLGSTSISKEHLERLSSLIKKIKPCFISEHLSWGYVNGIFMPDLLPVPYTEQSLEVLARNIDITQNYLNRGILIENPSSYIEYTASVKSEADFLVELCLRTGAHILLDINNIFVSAFNHNWDSKQYIDSIPKHLVKEIHLAGHSVKHISDNHILRIDTHDNPVCDEVWALYHYAIKRFGPIPTLIEWDADLPSLDILVKEASKAANYLLTHGENRRILHA